MIDIEQLKALYSNKIKPQYTSFGTALAEAIKEDLDKKNIRVHVITSRAKELESLIKKIVEKAKYKDLAEVTDLCGVRVITYLESDVDKVADVIKSTFTINEIVDKRNMEPDSFGYKSLHIIASLPQQWSVGIYSQYVGLKVEIQIRSILQHAWAEIEHDLGYKAEEELPYELKRGFSRLAAGLETSDMEFDRLVKSKIEYQQSIDNSIKNSTKEPILVNSLSLFEFIKENKILIETRELLKQEGVVAFAQEKDFSELLEKLNFFNINSIQELDELLSRNEQQLKEFSVRLYKTRKDKRPYLLNQSPLLYLLHYLAASQGRKVLDEYIAYGNHRVNEVVNFLDLYNEVQTISN